MLKELLTNDYLFTFATTAAAAIFKALSSREGFIFRRRRTWDFSLELVFIALSFAASNLEKVTNAEQGLRLQLTQLEQLAAGGQNTQTVSLAGIPAQQDQLKLAATLLANHGDALVMVCSFLALLLLLLTLLLRGYAYTEAGEPRLWQGLLLPNLVGCMAVVLVMLFSFNG